MIANLWHRLLVTLFLGLLIALSPATQAQKPDPNQEISNKVIAAIRFEGFKNLDAEEMRSKLELKEGGLFDEDTLKSNVLIIEKSLRERGYMYVQVKEVRAEPVKDDRLKLVFVIDSGDLYRVNELKLTGNDTFTSNQIAPTTHVVVGKLYSGSALEQDREMITSFYGARGYADASVEISSMEMGKGSLRMEYHIDEGKKSLLQEVRISGNSNVKAEEIRKEFRLAPGDVFNTVLIEKGRQALLRTGLFKTVEVSGVPAAKPGFKDLEITVKEK
ncbi:FtsQ-type POTRA domain-containing protein [Prosthecobacter sp.]|uniref:FtsQ-type POTRA domain-containing protein n=1 Tax=Prosthecobacter sp. TaxID=1965333 RepID=UPI0037836581